jgi:hypothetical protein
MRVFKGFNKRRIMAALVGGVLCLCFYKLYLYANNREQFEDSNLLISLAFACIAAAFIYLILKLISIVRAQLKAS